MKIEIKQTETGGSVHTFTSAQGKIRHTVIDVPTKCYEFTSSGGDSFGGTYSFNFHTLNDEGYDNEFIVTLIAENTDEAKQLFNIRFNGYDRGQWWILAISDELLEQDALLTT